MINYYRALSRKPLSPATQHRISCPTLTIWGKHDAYAVPELAEASMRLCLDGRIAWFDHSHHWIQHDEPDRVTALLTDFLTS